MAEIIDKSKEELAETVQKLGDAVEKLGSTVKQYVPISQFRAFLKNYNIDREKIFIFGQSMGSMGALFLGNKNAGIFKAIVCTGLLPNFAAIKGNPYPNLVKKPVFFAYGTEDFIGFDFAQKNAEIFASYLSSFQTYWNAGGYHSNSWARSLEPIFDFLNEQ